MLGLAPVPTKAKGTTHVAAKTKFVTGNGFAFFFRAGRRPSFRAQEDVPEASYLRGRPERLASRNGRRYVDRSVDGTVTQCRIGSTTPREAKVTEGSLNYQLSLSVVS